jgi:hypothetical protein
MTVRIYHLVLLVAAFLLGGWLSWKYFDSKRAKPSEEATVLLEKIRAVTKLSTVEGTFSEVYNYSEYQGYFTFFWDKKVLVRVRATVSAGYNLEHLNIQAEPNTKTIRINGIPKAEILSIDHELDYYDISEGIFNSFKPEDYNRINKRAKDLVRDQAMKSNLLSLAEEQGAEMLELLQFMVEGAGWHLEVGPREEVQEWRQ